MAKKSENFLIQVKTHETVQKPQQKTMPLLPDGWEIGWSTATNVPMMIDYFNVTVGRYLKEESEGGKKKIEDYWRASQIPPHFRKIKYAQILSGSTTTQPKPLIEGIYVVKIAGMSAVAEGLNVESGIGIAIIKLLRATDAEMAQIMANEHPKGVVITNDALLNLFEILDNE